MWVALVLKIMKHESAQLLICLAEHPLMIHSRWTLIACQLSRQPAGYRFLTWRRQSEKTGGKIKWRRVGRRGHLRAWCSAGKAGLGSPVAVCELRIFRFFLQEIIEVESENVFKLAANALQVSVMSTCTSICCNQYDLKVIWRDILLSPGSEWRLHQVWAH